MGLYVQFIKFETHRLQFVFSLLDDDTQSNDFFFSFFLDFFNFFFDLCIFFFELCLKSILNLCFNFNLILKCHAFTSTQSLWFCGDSIKLLWIHFYRWLHMFYLHFYLFQTFDFFYESFNFLAWTLFNKFILNYFLNSLSHEPASDVSLNLDNLSERNLWYRF